MSQNKNALIRYNTIDKCLQNTYRKWTLEDLIEVCSSALEEYEGKKTTISKRTIQLDIQFMRSSKLGYNAPIIVYDKKYYKYDDENYTITDIPLNETDINILSETLQVLKQFKDFSLFEDVSDILNRLEDKIYSEKTHTKSVIHLEKNELLKGLEHLDTIYQSIISKMVLEINYKSFNAREARAFLFHPVLLKEFNNRWFVLGHIKQGKELLTIALDRVLAIKPRPKENFLEMDFDAESHFKNVVGVTVNEGIKPKNIILWVDRLNAPYVLTKPLHHSQKILKEFQDGSIEISLYLVLNYELERLILGFGEGIKVLQPEKLKNRMIQKLQKSLGQYEDENNSTPPPVV
jgi:predicted DNA-binding transcriptional regulator YafY